jgi:hypothetical protein
MLAMTQPLQPQWNEDGSRWWDGSSWIPREDVPARQAELAQQEAARLHAEQAGYAQRYAEWHAQAVTEDPFTPVTAPPPPPPGVVHSAPPPGPLPTGYGTAIWSWGVGTIALVACVTVLAAAFGAFEIGAWTLVLLPVWGAGSLAAVVTGHVSRAQARRAQRTSNVWRRWGLLFGYSELGVLVVLLAAGGYAVSRDDLGAVGQSLTAAGQAQRAYRAYYGSYATNLAPTRYRPADGVTVQVLRADPTSYCMRGIGYGQTLYLSNVVGKVSKTSCA